MRNLYLALALLCLGTASRAFASAHHGQVLFNGLPVPGATVTATQGDKKFTALTDDQGAYAFPDLPDGKWKLTITLTGFAPFEQEVNVAPAAGDAPSPQWPLKLLPLDQILAGTQIIKPEAKPAPIEAPVVASATPAAKPKPGEPAPPAEAPKPSDETSQQANDGLLINGSVNNAATSQYTLAPAFGNQRATTKSLYTGGFGVIFTNSALDANSYSLTGQQTPKPSFNQVTTNATIGGPIRIPHILPRGPNFFVAYQWTRNSNDNDATGTVPTLAQLATPNINPIALALLKFYPQPNFTGSTAYNYQIPILTHTHQDSMQSRLDKTLGQKNQLYGGFGFQSSRLDNENLFKFVDHTGYLGIRSNINWVHRFSSRLFVNNGYTFSRARTETTPNFEYKQNVSANAGITSNDQDPTTWGPPSLSFSSGITGLSDANESFNRSATNAVSTAVTWYLRRHNFTYGADFRRQQFNYFQQQNPRGTYAFTGAATGVSDFADFAAGIPDTSNIAFGNPDKYLRQSVYDAYFADDWRIRPELTINAGLRWEYGAPITELKNRLGELIYAPNFASATQVRADQLSGTGLPNSLIRPDKISGIEPRIGLSWRPIPGSSLVVRSGYGIYDDTSVYQATALAMAQQSPFAFHTYSVSNSAACPLTLATGFAPPNCTTSASDPFTVDPNFHVGYAQVWNLSAQRDLPFALQMTATYLGIKGTHGVQQFLPNTYPIGATNPCLTTTVPTCPVGSTYRTSGGDSTRESGALQLRRRLRSGFTASLLYTYSKSVDDDAVLGGQGSVSAGATSQTSASAATAQNWLNLRGERARSTFDQRHLVNATFQYTSGQGLGGGTMLGGWRGRALKEWTLLGTLAIGSGLPETPTYYAAVPGTGDIGSIRGSLTGASIYTSPAAGYHLNPAAFTAPATGQWGTAGRDSITGPGQFTFNASLARTFRLDKRLNLDIRADSTNILNHPVYSSWVTVVGSSQFGLPASVNGMRTLQLTGRLRF